MVILVVVILGSEVFIPVAGHIFLEESHTVFEKFETVLSQFITEFATGDDDTPVGVVAYALALSQKRLQWLTLLLFTPRKFMPLALGG